MQPLTVGCSEISRDSLVLESYPDGHVCVSAFCTMDSKTEEIGIYLNRASVELVHSWLGEWLAR